MDYFFLSLSFDSANSRHHYDMNIDEIQRQVSITVPDSDLLPLDSDGEASDSSTRDQFRGFSANGMVQLAESGGGEYGVIEKCFLIGMQGISGLEITVVAVHKNSYSGASGQARVKAFRLFRQAVAEKRGGDANSKHGWYGGSRNEICQVISFGFRGCGDFVKGVSHGVGVYLSPIKFSIDSAVKSEEDENGVRHMLLCRVVLGNSETIPAGSEQSYPSSADFDSGVDDPRDPRKYVVWSAYMNSHIFPNYIVSFKARSLIGLGGALNCANKHNSLSIRLSVLLDALSRCMNPSQIGLVSKCSEDFWEQKIDKSELVKTLRKLVGDEMLVSAVKLCWDGVKLAQPLHGLQ